ncbi:hypothetical protein TWF788_004326 [Orbilia oligospora]|uniref:Uncharacterized protein n=1 Tax=Orbilia oligospora TaxID=2813651 RepID=A0A7C8UFJ0_ORBOL|nr:hypothetical protein TWF788_004326 [Orbilia oligospora]
MGYLIWNNSISVLAKEFPYLNYEADHIVDPIYFFKWVLRIIWMFVVYQVILIAIVAFVIKMIDIVKTFLEVNGYIESDPGEWFGAPSTWKARRNMHIEENKGSLGEGPLLRRVLGVHED